jgi:putative CocE/NonD family hydrolase
MAGSLLGERAGPADLARILARTDVLVYESAPLERPVTIIGPVRLRIHATSALASFDIVGHLADIGPDGHAELLTGGILRVVPDRSDEERIVDLGATAAVIPEGHRVGLVLAASDFPRFDLNPASAAAGSSSTEIHHSALRPSRLILPLLEG